jgi:hypothetical protein
MGNLVDPMTMDRLKQIAALQAPIDAAQDKMNSYKATKLSLEMTIDELTNMGVPTEALAAEAASVDKQLAQSAGDYAKTVIEQEAKILPLRSKATAVNFAYETPMDYNRSVLKSIPLASDSLKMDAQFFDFESNTQDTQNVISSIRAYVAGATSVLGADRSFEMATAAAKQVNQQVQEHDITGTLVITATATHRNSTVIAPLILDPDKAIRVWNQVFTSSQDKLKMDAAHLAQIAMQEDSPDEKSLSIISGCTYGSSFVGMVHILRNESTTTNQDMESDTADIQAQANQTSVLGAWFESAQGGFGIDSSFADDLKDLLSKNTVNAHVSLIAQGFVPNIKSNDVVQYVQQLANFDPKSMGDQLATLANATEVDHKTVESSAQAARTGQTIVSMQGATVKSAMSSLAKIEGNKNKMIDINSMMTAFDSYVQAALAGKITGVPVNFYLKPITKSQIAHLWVNKYYPSKFLAISGDDSALPPKKGAPAAAQPAQSADNSGGGTDPNAGGGGDANGAGSDPNAGGGDRGDGSGGGGGGGGGDANGGDGSQQSS